MGNTSTCQEDVDFLLPWGPSHTLSDVISLSDCLSVSFNKLVKVSKGSLEFCEPSGKLIEPGSHGNLRFLAQLDRSCRQPGDILLLIGF